MVAAAVLISIGTMVTVTLLQNPIGGTSTAAPSAAIDRQLQCTSINREYDAWARGKDGMTRLADGDDAGYFVKQLMEEGQAFAKATRGYGDAATKQLAVTVASYNVDLAALNMSVMVTGELPADEYRKVVDSWAVVETAFRAFKDVTC